MVKVLKTQENIVFMYIKTHLVFIEIYWLAVLVKVISLPSYEPLFPWNTVS